MTQQARSIDGIRFAPRASAPPPAPQPARRPFSLPRSQPPSQPQRGAWAGRFQLPLIMVLAVAAGLFAQSGAFGQIVVVAYGITAYCMRINSRITFMLALAALGAMSILLLGKGDVALAQNFATYTFLLLVVGVMSLGRELKKEGGRIYSIRTRRIEHH